MLGCNCRTTQLQLQIPNTLCRLSAQERIGAKTAQLQLQIANTLCRLSAQAKLQRRPPLQIHRKIGLLSRLVRMYCSHLLDAASVLNCRWLYYTQEDANGMYDQADSLKVRQRTARCGALHGRLSVGTVASGTGVVCSARARAGFLGAAVFILPNVGV